MKKTLLFKMFTISFLLFASIGWVNGQTTINLDTDANWIQDGSTSFSSYGAHAYSEAGVTITGTNVLRNGIAAQDGFPGALGIYSMRAGNTAVSKVRIDVSTGGISTFSLKVRRWDGSPMPLWYVKYSVDGGNNWIPLADIDGTLLITSDWFTYNGTINSSENNVLIDIANSGTTERIMIDNFSWTGYSTEPDVTPPSFTVIPHNNDIDVAVDVPIVLTFDEAIRNIDDSEITDANVGNLLTLTETNASGAVVDFNATIDVDKKIITVIPAANLANGQVYYAAIAPVEDAANNATTESSMTFTTISASAATISEVTITEVSPYFAGDKVNINWVSSNVTNVQIEVWIPSESKWDIIIPTTPSNGTVAFTIPADAQYSADYKLRITDVANPAVSAESSIFTIICVANDLLTLRKQPVNAIVKYTGVATVTYARTYRNQKYIQDATAAVLIDDPTTAPGFITGTYNIGDGITNVVGKILLYGGLVEFTPTATTGEPTVGIEIVPEVRTLESLTSDDQCKLVKIENFAFTTPTQFDATGKFVASQKYDIDGFVNTAMVYRTTFSESDYIGGMVPVGPFASVVLVGQYNVQMQITARSWSDMTLPFVAPDLVITEIMYNSPGDDEEWIEVFNNGTSPVDISGYYILDADPTHIAAPMVIPAGNVVAPGEYFTIETSTSGAFPFVPNCDVLDGGIGKFNFGNTSDQVKLYAVNGQLIDSVQYMDSAPWPTAADGGGSSLTLCDPNLDNSLASSWEASLDEFTTLQSTTIYATPGTGCILHTAVAPKLHSGITLYPNPTSDNLYISNPSKQVLEITILSSIGKQIKSLQVNQGTTSVDLSDMPKGIYLVKMLDKTSKTIQTNKVVVR